jgi:hypothetical protein
VGAEVIAFPEPDAREPSCFICSHAVVGSQTYCTLFAEFVLREGQAVECDEYDEDEEKS